MTGPEIRTLVDKKNEEIEKSLFKETFVLNPEIKILQEEIVELQNKCNHDFKNGTCIFCDVEE